MSTLFAWIHLSDLHFCRDSAQPHWDPARVEAQLRSDIAGLLPDVPSPDAILVTGDVAAEGRSYEPSRRLLLDLAASVKLGAGDVFVVPGNHDVDRGADEDRSVARLVRGLREGDDPLDDALANRGDRALLARRLAGFLDFAGGFAPACLAPPSPGEERLFWAHRREVRGRTVRLVGLNTALLGARGDDQGKLRIGAEQLAGLRAPNGELVVALSHHPFKGGWLADEKSARVAVENHVHVHLHSHAHAAVSGEERSSGERTATVAAGLTADPDKTGFSYNFAAVIADEAGQIKLRVWPRRWSPINREFRTDVDSVPDRQAFAERVIPGTLLDAGPMKPSAQALHLVATPRGAQAHGPGAEPDEAVGYLSSVKIENIRSIGSLLWRVPPAPGWNVVIGDNGAGKSSFLRSIAIALLLAKPIDDPGRGYADSMEALRLDWGAWIRTGRDSGRIELTASVKIAFGSLERTSSIWTSGRVSSYGSEAGLSSLFSAGFGPFRRFSGGDAEYEKQFTSLPRVSRHLSLFDERVSLTESLRWLKDLQFKALEDASNAAFLERVTSFINQEGFLPSGVRLHRITSDAVTLIDGNGCEIAIEQLSDGYRSILSLAIELIRQFAAHYGHDQVFDMEAKTVIAPGIVLIDEVDAHLHPTWQREIGLRLTLCFPRVQFVVTTHSPLVCQAADVGTVFSLPRPGTEEVGREIRGAELGRLLYGDVLEAYGTEVFGEITRSEKARSFLQELARLNRKELDQGLTDEERRRQRELLAIFPSAFGDLAPSSEAAQ